MPSLADLKQQLKDQLAEYDRQLKSYAVDTAAELKQRQADIAKIRDRAEKTQAQKDLAQWQKDRAAGLTQLQTDRKTFNTTQNQAIQKRGLVETQAKKLDIEPDEYEQFLSTAKQYNQLKQEYKPYLGQLTENKTRDAAIAEIAKAQKLDPSVLKNYFAAKEIEPLYQQATQAQQQAKAQAEAAAKAAQEQAAARQAQMQQYAQEAAQIAQQRKSQNYSQMYNLLTQNMPMPVGYGQPASSQQARTTTIGAGGDDQMGRQMSPAQIARRAGIIPQGTPLPPELMQQLAQQQASRQAAQQQVSQETPQGVQPAKRGGIMRGM